MKRMDEVICKTEDTGIIYSSNPAAETFFVKVKAGSGVLRRGSILAKDDAGAVLLDTAHAGKGYAIVAEELDTAEETVALCYRTGHFIANKLIAEESYTLTADDKEALRGVGILLSDAVEV